MQGPLVSVVTRSALSDRKEPRMPGSSLGIAFMTHVKGRIVVPLHQIYRSCLRCLGLLAKSGYQLVDVVCDERFLGFQSFL